MIRDFSSSQTVVSRLPEIFISSSKSAEYVTHTSLIQPPDLASPAASPPRSSPPPPLSAMPWQRPAASRQVKLPLPWHQRQGRRKFIWQICQNKWRKHSVANEFLAESAGQTSVFVGKIILLPYIDPAKTQQPPSLPNMKLHATDRENGSFRQDGYLP